MFAVFYFTKVSTEALNMGWNQIEKNIMLLIVNGLRWYCYTTGAGLYIIFYASVNKNVYWYCKIQ